MADIHCPMIHAGLNINLKQLDNSPIYNQCCLNTELTNFPKDHTSIWNSKFLSDLRNQNDNNEWNKGCWECERLEKTGAQSFRQAMINTLGISKNVSGPKRIDLLFDRSCNLACLPCGPASSTFWTKHLQDNNLPVIPLSNNTMLDKMYDTLKTLDLSNLEIVQFCGGETLLGNTYWKAAEIIADLVPDAKDKITLGFQTNCTQTIAEKNYKTIEKFKLVRFLFSLDSVGEKFEYLRWPANWNQVTENLMEFREKLPVNVMFFVQEVITPLNLLYRNDVPNWIKENFSTNRLGDPVEYSAQLAIHNLYDINHITQEYVDAIKNLDIRHAITANWQENPAAIKKMIASLDLFDGIRNKNWKTTFPEVAEFYARYI